MSWNEILIDSHGLHQERKRVPVAVREDGSYTLCGLPNDVVIASAEVGARHTGLVEVTVPPSGIVRRDFVIGDSTAVVAIAADSSGAAASVRSDSITVLRGTARLSGMVRGPGGKPSAGAKIFVWGTGLTATAGDDGNFAIDGLPAGTFSVEARALGFEPTRAAVDLSSHHTARVSLLLDKRPQQLASVLIMGKRSDASRDITGFLDRMQHGMGHYITASDIDKYAIIQITDALRMTPGVAVVPGRGFGDIIRFSHGSSLAGPCTPVVYLDGMQVYQGDESLDDLIQPDQVAGIEVYTGLGTVPPQYQANGCGVVLVWSKH